MNQPLQVKKIFRYNSEAMTTRSAAFFFPRIYFEGLLACVALCSLQLLEHFESERWREKRGKRSIELTKKKERSSVWQFTGLCSARFSSSSSFSFSGCCWQWLDDALRVTHFFLFFLPPSLSLFEEKKVGRRARTERSKNIWHTRCRCSLVDQPRPVKNERKNMNFFFNLPVLIVVVRRQTEERATEREREKWVQFLLSFSHVPTLNCSMSEFYPMTTRSSVCAWSESESKRLFDDDSWKEKQRNFQKRPRHDTATTTNEERKKERTKGEELKMWIIRHLRNADPSATERPRTSVQHTWRKSELPAFFSR